MNAVDGPVEVGVSKKGRLRRVTKLVRLLRHPGYRQALRSGVAAAVEHERVAWGQAFRTVIDVGAHHGQFALFARRQFPDAMIICVEPLPEAQQRLRTILDADSRAEVIGVAAASASGSAEYHVSRATDSSSLLPITSLYTTAFPRTEEASIAAVETARLDDLVGGRELERPVLLKIDVQGSELEVLRGAEVLLGVVDAVFVECSFVEFYEGQPLIDEVIDHLHAPGFRLSGVYSVVRDGRFRCLQADLLFTRR